MAQPSKLTPERSGAVITAIAAGETREGAAAYASITDRTLYNWMARGREAKSGEYFQFFQALKKAEADASLASVMRVRAAAADHWQAAAWYLERRYPERWGRQDRATLKDQEQRARELAERVGIDPEELIALAAELK